MARILVIDDESQVRKLIRHILEPEGYEIIEAFDGDDGLQLFLQTPVDLVITDLFMPNKDGLAVIQELRRMSPRIKIITITAGLGDDCARAHELGAARTLVKPLNMEELRDTVREILRSPHTPAI